MQPAQQQGRRFPSFSSSVSLLICSFLVSSFLTEIIQQIHSFLASGVISFHAARTAESETMIFRKSDGILCSISFLDGIWFLDLLILIIPYRFLSARTFYEFLFFFKGIFLALFPESLLLTVKLFPFT